MTKHHDMTVDDKTKINLFAVIFALPTLVGGIVWLTAIDAKASAALDEQRGNRQLLEKLIEKTETIDARLSRIEGKLEK